MLRQIILIAPHLFWRPIRPIRSNLRQTPRRQSRLKPSSTRQRLLSTPKEKRLSPNFASAEANGGPVMSTYLRIRPTALFFLIQPLRHGKDTHIMERRTRRAKPFTTN